MTFATYFWDLLPSYFFDKDSYKDGDNKGLLQRYLGIFGAEIDEWIYGKATNYLDVLDPTTESGKFLDYIAYTLGNPPDIFNDPVAYRTFILKIIPIYRKKGILESYRMCLRLLGFILVSLNEDFPESVKADEGFHADTSIFADSGSAGSIPYDIYITDLDGNGVDITDAVKDKINTMLILIEPTEAKLRNILTFFPLNISETVAISGSEGITLVVNSTTIISTTITF